jgi:hypothetical protein
MRPARALFSAKIALQGLDRRNQSAALGFKARQLGEFLRWIEPARFQPRPDFL